MSVVVDGFGATEGIGFGPVQVLHWGAPEVPHQTVSTQLVDREVERFHAAREWSRQRLNELKAHAEERLGPVEARIFDPQIVMLDDVEIAEGTVRYIRENRLSAPRAFQWRMLELHTMWTRRANAMVLDKLNDLEDLKIRLLTRLLGLPDPTAVVLGVDPVILVAANITPSLTAQLDSERIAGIATDGGTRTSHWAILARSLSIPAVVGLRDITTRVRQGQLAILDGRIGRVVLDPDEHDRAVFEERRSQLLEMEEEIVVLAGQESVTRDGQPVVLRANLDLPEEADDAKDHGAEGVGLYRTEFLVVGRAVMPGRKSSTEPIARSQKRLRTVASTSAPSTSAATSFRCFCTCPPRRTRSSGGVPSGSASDEPQLFRTQLRAILRSTAHGDVHVLLPLINDSTEIQRTRAMLREEEDTLEKAGIAYDSAYKVGIMIETPAAALDAAELAKHADYFSIGTNDLVQYTLAVDRANARLASMYSPFHPAVVHLLRQVAGAARSADIEVSICGELAANPVGTFLLLGLGITSLSVAWPALPEVKHAVRSFSLEEARHAARRALAASSASEVFRALVDGIGNSVDLAAFSGRWNLSPGG